MIRLIRTGRDRLKLTVIEPDGERSQSSYADDKAVADFTTVAKSQGLPLDYDREKRIAERLRERD